MVRISDMLKRRVLVARVSARELEGALAQEARGASTLVIDFDGVEAVAPSFVDELLTMIGEARTHGAEMFVFANMPMRFASKYSMLAEAHSKQIEIDATGERESWILTPAAPAAAPTL